MRTEPAPQRPAYAKESCGTAFPYAHSPLGSQLRLNELNVREGPWEPRQYDTLSNALLTNHNIWTFLDSFKRANELFDNQSNTSIPEDYLQCIELIGRLFAHDDAISASYELERHLKLLDSIAPMTM